MATQNQISAAMIYSTVASTTAFDGNCQTKLSFLFEFQNPLKNLTSEYFTISCFIRI